MMGDTKSEQVKSVFSAISEKYDLLDSFISLGMDQKWRKTLVNNIPETASRVVECGAGTGKLTSLILRRITGSVSAIDITEKMAKNPDPSRVSYVIGSADATPFPDEFADCVVSAFLTRNLDSVSKYTEESYRVLKKGGIFLNLDIFNPPGKFRKAFSTYFFKIVPFAGDLLTQSNSYSYLASSVQGFIKPGEFSRKLKISGFEDITARTFAFGSIVIHKAIKGGK